MKKKICMIVYGTYPLDTRVRREAEALTSLLQYEVTILACKNGSKANKFEVNGVKVIEVRLKKYQGKSILGYMFSYFKFMLLTFFKCTGLLLKRKLDVVHIHNMPNFLIFAAILPRMFGKKVILDIHDSVPETYSAKFGSSPSSLLIKIFCWEEKICCRIANRLISVNHVQRDELVKRGIDSRKITISMNVPDHNLFTIKKEEKEYRQRSNHFKLVYHGTISKRLGLDLIIHAVSNLKEKIPGIEFFIYGNGDDLEDFIELSKKLKVDNRVHFSRWCPLDDLMKSLVKMDAGIVGNRKNIATELMLPGKMLEYVALGIPVIVPRLKAIQYYFTDEMVSYFEPENVDSMTRAILKIFRDKSLSSKQAAAAKEFLKQYGWEKHQWDLTNFYKAL